MGGEPSLARRRSQVAAGGTGFSFAVLAPIYDHDAGAPDLSPQHGPSGQDTGRPGQRSRLW